MGLFGALTTAVTGMRAQSFALENISGNIANSQTTAFKRMDTSFVDVIPDEPPSKQQAGNIVANARATNTVQGDVQTSSVGTFMAINGAGYFVTEKPSSVVDNRPVFSGVDLYTRRGDFQPDKSGFLVNGAGYYLMGIPIDSTTGNLIGSAPQVLKFQNDFLSAQATTSVDYRANLASYPLTSGHDVNIPRSELLDPSNFIANPLVGPASAAQITGTGATLLPDAPAKITASTPLPGAMINAGSFTINGSGPINITAGMNAAAVRAAINAAAPPGLVIPVTQDGTGHLQLQSVDADTTLVIASGSAAMLAELGLSTGTTQPTNLLTQSAVGAGDTLIVTIGANPPTTITFGNAAGQVSTLAELNGASGLGSLTFGIGSVNPANGNITITASNPTDNISISGTALPKKFGMHTTTAIPSNQTVVANDVTAFLSSTIGGGAVTAYDVSGAPANIQLRWAKIDSSASGGTDTWNLFYQVNSNATGNQVAWQNVGTNYTFSPNGQMNPPIGNVTLSNVVVDGVALGDVQLVHGLGGITQFADPNGSVQVNILQQNGFPAGQLQTVTISDKGRLTGSYSNGRTIDLAEISIANFNGPNGLKRLDGGAFEATDESGAAIFGSGGKIVGSSLEGSNSDIADEFTKLIVTQQAYSANTKVITTTNQMVQDLLNILR
ncbi:MAG: flagellar hook protein FlgE [Alphaproteobacteria bacterium]|jgi:flagellar hook protein FlgE|nr:flagellar hook protein FlgE [Alphaproteobacteria bacterium]